MSTALDRALRERSSQLTKARNLQSHLHPDHPAVQGLALSIRYEPVTEVGGDFYDVLQPRPGNWLLIIGDVAGQVFFFARAVVCLGRRWGAFFSRGRGRDRARVWGWILTRPFFGLAPWGAELPGKLVFESFCGVGALAGASGFE